MFYFYFVKDERRPGLEKEMILGILLCYVCDKKDNVDVFNDQDLSKI